jgi:adenylate cyclase
MERKLAAIFAADVAGYSALMEEDEERTHAAFLVCRGVAEAIIIRHRGRIFGGSGDSIMAEFGSPVEALRAAIEFQQDLAGRTLDLPRASRMNFRIGINLGDVMIDREGLFGDDVNIANRLQTLAEPGGIAIARNVYDQVKHKMGIRFEPFGDHHVKNIAEPITVYRIVSDSSAERTPILKRLPFLRRKWRTAMALIVLLVAIDAGLLAWIYFSGTSAPPQRLSIVALPFKTPDNSPEYEYFSEGILNDLTTDLSRIEGSIVISANTAATYKGRAIDTKQIGRELNVRYILEGSLRRLGNRVRIVAQLIDATTGVVVWADRFEGEWANSVELQDQITGQLARTLDLELIAAESRRAESERPNSPDAVDHAMRGWKVLNRPLARHHVADAQKLFEQALYIDPDLPKALIGLGRTLTAAVNARWSSKPAEDLARADDAVTRVLLSSPNDAMAHYVKGEILRGRKDFESAIGEYQVAISINRNLAPAYATLGNTYIRAGRAKEAFEPLQTAIRLSPRDPLLNIWYYWTCHAHIHLAQDELAIEWCRRSVALNPYWAAYIDLAAAYGWTGRQAEARAALADLDRLMPNYTVDRWRNEDWSDNPVFLAEYQHIIEGLQKAGMREK